MQKRISVEKSELRRVQKSLKTDGFTLQDISDTIGASFGSYLYQGYNMSEDVFKKLEDLYGGEIKHQKEWFINGRGYDNPAKKLSKSSEVSELIGILLGDGHINNYSEQKDGQHIASYYVSVVLHEEEEEMISRCKSLLNRLIGKTPKICPTPHARTVDMRVFGKDAVMRLQEIGLTPGNKVEKQVGVPPWIKDSENCITSCLKGLIDTDGSIYRRSHDGYKVVYFKNHSYPLLRDFRTMCRSLNISTSKSGEYAVQVAAQEDVNRFMEKVQPIKRAP